MNTETTPPRTKAVGFVHFHGRDLLVVHHQGIEYTEAKPLSDGCGLFWKATKRTISSDENAVFYGTAVLLLPEIGDFGTTRGPKSSLYLRLDRIWSFIGRINTAHVRAKDKHETADFIMALQREWADALHAYETHSIAIKPGSRESKADDLLKWTRLRNKLSNAEDRRVIDQLIHEELTALAAAAISPTLDDDQLPLPLPDPA